VELELARRYADEVAEHVAPYCDRVEIAGGVRRGKVHPHDIELVVIPKLESSQSTFDRRELQNVDLLYRKLSRLRLWPESGSHIQKALADKAGRAAPLGPRCYRVLWKGEKVDIFAVLPPAQFGVIYAVRTGDAAFTQSLYGIARSKGMRFEDGCIRNGKGETLRTPEERDVFAALGVSRVEPKNRSLIESEAIAGVQ
jgi:DNA polymerase/3'-5' exonuclease PolX